MCKAVGVLVYVLLASLNVHGQSNGRAQAQGMASPPPAIVCKGHADGLYVRDPNACNDGFYKCANGRVFYYKCPGGLFFSTDDAQCEYKSIIPACGGVRPTQRPPVAPQAAAHQVAPAIPVQPIAPVYPISYPAPAAPLAAAQPSYAEAASSYAEPEPYADAAPVAASEGKPEYVAAPTYVQEVPVAPVSPAETSAQYVAPAPYISTGAPAPVAPSQPEYVAPAPYVSATAPALETSYAPEAAVAPAQPQYQAAYEAASAAPQPEYGAPAPPAYAPVAPAAPASYAPAAPRAAATTPRPPVDYNCGAKSDGYYFKQPCGSTFYSCSGGIAMKLDCPPGTGYDAQTQSCEHKTDCGKPKPKTTTVAPVNYGYGPQAPTTKAPSRKCVGKADGFYESGRCKPEYLHCANAQAFELTCPAQLVFKNHSCIYSSDCWNPTTPAPIAVQTTKRPKPTSSWCQQNGKTDGNYGHGCGSKFYICNAGFTTVLDCPTGTAYDETQHTCELKQHVPACGGRRPPSTTTVAAPIAPARRVNYNCAGKPNGYHSSGCSSSYYSCIEGVASEINCPGGTKYSPQLQSCDYTAHIPECGGRLPTTTVAAPVAAAGASAPSYGYSAPAAAPVAPNLPQYTPPVHAPAPPPVPQASEASAPSQYAAPVAPVAPVAPQYSPAVAAPVAPATPEYSAPAAPVAPAASEYAAPASLAPATEYTAPAPAVSEYVASSVVAYEVGGSQHAPVTMPWPVAQAAIPPAPVAAFEEEDSNPCKKLPDGIYGRRCSRHYFVCSVHKTYEFTCPTGYAYDRQLARCGHLSGIQHCSTATQQQPARA